MDINGDYAAKGSINLDFINSLKNDSNPEVGIIEGISSLSLAYSFIESGYVEGQINMSDFSSNGNQKYLI